MRGCEKGDGEPRRDPTDRGGGVPRAGMAAKAQNRRVRGASARRARARDARISAEKCAKPSGPSARAAASATRDEADAARPVADGMTTRQPLHGEAFVAEARPGRRRT